MANHLRRLVFLMLLDSVAVALALWLSFMLRFDGYINAVYQARFFLALPFFLLCSLPLYLIFGLYRSIWKFSGLHDYLAVIAAVSLTTLPLLLGRYFMVILIPYSVLGINWFISLLLVGGLRAAARLPGEFKSRSKGNGGKRVLIIGAGQAGAMILRELRTLGLNQTYHPVGFIDDDPRKNRAFLDGVAVLGDRHLIPSVVREEAVDEIIIAIPSAPRGAVREIVAICRETGASLKILPGIYQLIEGQVSVKALRDVAIEDLLGRPPVATDLNEIASYLEGQVVLVTGAGGSIGSELCRQIVRFAPAALLLLGRGENSVYQIQQELTGAGMGDGRWAMGDSIRRTPEPGLSRKQGATRIIPIVADVRDRERLRNIFAAYRPAVIFHAAAHKHVPLMEEAPDEAVKNNVFGTLNLAELADEYGAKSFVLISTDKAVSPASVMGATKRAAELIVQDLAAHSATSFCAVRFGNVLGSRGSVIPLFQRQIAAGGPVTVTDPGMVRYFMTIPEAANLVIQAGAMGRGGEIFILDMGEPVRIMDLARDLIRLSGFEPDKEIEIVFTGPRPGEKLAEEILTAEEEIGATKHERIFVAKPGRPAVRDLPAALGALRAALAEPATCLEGLRALTGTETGGEPE